MRWGAAALVLAAVGCGRAYDPARDRYLPRPPRVETFTAAATIDAPPSAVWAVLVDWPAYASWNPWIVRAEGEGGLGGQVRVSVRLGERTRAFDHRIVEVVPGTRFCWRDEGPTTAAVTGMRCRQLEALPDGRTRFTQTLTLGGPMRGTARRRFGPDLEAGMEAETAALAAEVVRRR